jgi:hypothetical protein
MSDLYTISIQWAPREESPGELAIRLKQMFAGLHDISTMFQKWMNVSKSPRIHQLPLCKFPPEEAELTALIAKKAHFEGSKKNRHLYGYRLQGWNDLGHTNIIAFYMHLGISTEEFSSYPNQIDITLAARNEIGKLEQRDLIPAWHCMIEAWEPDRGSISSYKFVSKSRGPADPYLCGSWGAYVPAADMTRAALPEGLIIQKVQDYGFIVLSTPGIFSADNPKQITDASKLQEAIEPVWSAGRFGRKKQ